MIAKIRTGAVSGVDGFIVEAEVDVSAGLFAFDIVGLPDSAVKESKERVRAALRNSGYELPIKKITVNLAPADVRKEGAGYDLPIAAGILACSSVINEADVRGAFIAGELSLDGAVRPIHGVLPLVSGAKKAGVADFFVPHENAAEAALIEGINVFAVKHLKELARHFRSEEPLKPIRFDAKGLFTKRAAEADVLDFADIKGQNHVKRALLIAAAGAHNILLSGPPGSGKTMAAKRLSSIMPELTFEESIDCLKIYSVAGLLVKGGDKTFGTRPFRSPHHTLSLSALTGGGKFPKPGEISLSHNGVLFLDELPEFDKAALESLRQPMEDGKIVISRVNGTVEYPSSFMLVASMNPCPCGYYGDDSGKCSCMPAVVGRYLSKISGPLLDRIDIMAEALRVDFDKLTGDDRTNEKARVASAEMRETVKAARKIQAERNGAGIYNGRLATAEMNKFCVLDAKCKDVLRTAFDKLGFSARAYGKILKTARTIADIEGCENLLYEHVVEAVQYRFLDRKYTDMRGYR